MPVQQVDHLVSLLKAGQLPPEVPHLLGPLRRRRLIFLPQPLIQRPVPRQSCAVLLRSLTRFSVFVGLLLGPDNLPTVGQADRGLGFNTGQVEIVFTSIGFDVPGEFGQQCRSVW